MVLKYTTIQIFGSVSLTKCEISSIYFIKNTLLLWNIITIKNTVLYFDIFDPGPQNQS